MSMIVRDCYFKGSLKELQLLGLSLHRQPRRWQSTTSASAASTVSEAVAESFPRPVVTTTSPLARLSTSSILRSLILSKFFSNPLLFRPGFAILRKIADSKSRFLNPDKNPVLKAVVKPLIYDQFCAGTTRTEIKNTVASIKGLGFSGVILCYGKELTVDHNKEHSGITEGGLTAQDVEIRHWRDGNIQTLGMVGEGDWLGIKYTGAGQSVMGALLRGEAPPQAFLEAMDQICETAAGRNCRIWIDAEQQAVQSTIDLWTIDLMRRWNRRSKPLIYNTVQAYLKASRDKLQHQLHLAEKEGWVLGVKLVRGAYISHDIRSRIHDTKAETDASYEGIVKDLLQGTLPGFSQDNFPQLGLFLAGHNSKTIRGATVLARQLSEKGKLKVVPEFGQLQGMADDIGCELLQCGDELRSGTKGMQNSRLTYVPRVYKCLTWGTVQECMQYLVRRTVENQGAAERLKEGSAGFAQELRRRILDGFWRRPSTNT